MLARLAARHEKLVFEPGRSLVGNAGLLLTRVAVLKPGAEKHFAVVDAAMNDLMRPALYDAWHDIVPVAKVDTGAAMRYEIVGPVCESGDFLGHDRELALREGDLLAILSAGAYGMAMASNYNSRPRAAEVMVDGSTMHLIRRREDIAELFALESTLP
jgi:diaminopimelate decarboxylase